MKAKEILNKIGAGKKVDRNEVTPPESPIKIIQAQNPEDYKRLKEKYKDQVFPRVVVVGGYPLTSDPIE